MGRREIAKRVGRIQQPLLWETEYVAAEQNLETIGFFSARYTRPSLREEKNLSKIVALSDGRHIEIVPAAKYGFPNAEDLDYYRAFLKICDEQAEFVAIHESGRLIYHPRLPSPIGFSTRELIAKAGKVKNGRGHTAVRTWIERMNSTTIHGALFNAKLRKYDVRIGLEPLFRQYVHVGRPMSDGEPAAQNYVWLASWFLDNYYHLYARRIDLKFHHSLSHAISKTLYPLLDTGWYAAGGGPYTKRYEDLCTVLGIKAYKQVSKARYQLDPSNEELLTSEFVGRYDYPVGENGEWTGNVRWWPGPKWLYDQEAKQRQRRGEEPALLPTTAPEPQHDGAGRSSQMVLPLLIEQRVAGDPSAYAPCVVNFYDRVGQKKPSREKVQMGVSVVQNLVEEQHYTLGEIEYSLDWIVRNVSTRFNGRVQSLGILPHVIGEALQEKTHSERKRERRREQEREQDQDQEHDAEVQKLVAKLAELPSETLEHLRAEAIKSLIGRGFQRQFLLENLVRNEMACLFERGVEV